MVKFISSVLFVNDIKVSRTFYEEILNQEVEIDYGVNVGYVGGFSIWKKDEALKNIFRTTEINKENNEDKGHQIELYFEACDLDEVITKLLVNHIELVHDLFVQPWGQRVIRVYDPDQYIIEIGEPMNAVIRRFYENGMTLEEVAKKSSTPLNIVRSIIEDKELNTILS